MRQSAVSKCRIVLMRAIFVESRRVANRVFPCTNTKHFKGKTYFNALLPNLFTFVHILFAIPYKPRKVILLLNYLVMRQVLRQIEAIARFVDLCSNMALAFYFTFDPVVLVNELTFGMITSLASNCFIMIHLSLSPNAFQWTIAIVHRISDTWVASHMWADDFISIILKTRLLLFTFFWAKLFWMLVISIMHLSINKDSCFEPSDLSFTTSIARTSSITLFIPLIIASPLLTFRLKPCAYAPRCWWFKSQVIFSLTGLLP